MTLHEDTCIHAPYLLLNMKSVLPYVELRTHVTYRPSTLNYVGVSTNATAAEPPLGLLEKSRFFASSWSEPHLAYSLRLGLILFCSTIRSNWVEVLHSTCNVLF